MKRHHLYTGEFRSCWNRHACFDRTEPAVMWAGRHGRTLLTNLARNATGGR